MASKTHTKTHPLLDDYKNDLSAIEPTHQTFDDKEKVLMSQPIDSISNRETKARKVVDPTLLSATLEQNNKEMAQMPSGKVVALTQQNKGKSLMMDITLHNHVIPHANSQYDAYTKLWLLSLYRKVYGSFGVLVDYVSSKGYTGPDFTLLPARSIIPFRGKTTVDDGVWVRSRVSKSWLKGRDKGVWKNIDKVLETSGDSVSDLNSTSFVERQHDGIMFVKDEYELISRYEGDRWRTFHSGTKLELRDIKNPQKNDQVPVVMCHMYPLLDRFFGLGDYERGLTLHAAQSSLINLYLDGVKMGIFPPMQIDPATIDNWEDLKDGIGPGSIIFQKKGSFDGINQLNISPAGIESFQSTYNFLKATILNVTHTSDTSVSASTDPGFGKTPQALKMQAFTQGMQAQFGRRQLEIATEKIFDRMIDLIAKRQEKPMTMYLEEADLRKVQEVAPDVVEMFEVGNMGRVVIKPQQIANVEYRYVIDQGSTVKTDEGQENEALTQILKFISEIPNALESLAQGGKLPLGNKMIDVGELIKRWIISKGVTDWDKIVIENENGQNVLNMENQNVQNAVTQAFAGAPNNQGQQPPMPPQQPPMPSQQPPMPVQPPMPAQPQINFEDPAIAQAFQELQGLGGASV